MLMFRRWHAALRRSPRSCWRRWRGTGGAHTRASATEESVGIEVFRSPSSPGFRGVIKARFTDFQVNELLPDGTVLHLRDVAARAPRPRRPAAADRKRNETEAAEEAARRVAALLGEEAARQVQRFVVASRDSAAARPTPRTECRDHPDDDAEPPPATEPPPPPPHLLLPASADKPLRTEIHAIVRECLPAFISDTVDGPGGHSDKAKRVRLRRRGGQQTPQGAQATTRRGGHGRRGRSRGDGGRDAQYDMRGGQAAWGGGSSRPG